MTETFTHAQLDKFADVLITIGQVFFASIVVPFFFSLERVDLALVPSGISLSLGSWILSVLLVREVKE